MAVATTAALTSPSPRLINVRVGSIVKFEGILVTDKDFGHGYQYDLLLENAREIEKEAQIKVN
jgi:hypothetical protein